MASYALLRVTGRESGRPPACTSRLADFRIYRRGWCVDLRAKRSIAPLDSLDRADVGGLRPFLVLGHLVLDPLVLLQRTEAAPALIAEKCANSQAAVVHNAATLVLSPVSNR